MGGSEVDDHVITRNDDVDAQCGGNTVSVQSDLYSGSVSLLILQ